MLMLFVLICLGIICFQDMRDRAVDWMLFLILALLLFVWRPQHWTEILIDSAYNLSFLSFQLLILWIYLSLKNRQLLNITSKYLGLGDILFLTAIAFLFSPANYVLFYIVSLILILLYTVAQRGSKKNNNLSIPLAGLQALFLNILLMISIINPRLKLYHDSWIYGF